MHSRTSNLQRFDTHWVAQRSVLRNSPETSGIALGLPGIRGLGGLVDHLGQVVRAPWLYGLMASKLVLTQAGYDMVILNRRPSGRIARMTMSG